MAAAAPSAASSSSSSSAPPLPFDHELYARRRAALAEISEIALNLDSGVPPESFSRLSSLLSSYAASYAVARRRFSDVRPLVVVSFVDDSLDHPMFTFFSSFTDPGAAATSEDKAILFVRMRYVDKQITLPMAGPCEVMVWLGHGSAGNSCLSSQVSGGRIYTRDRLVALVAHFQPRALILVVCEAAADACGSLVSMLLQWCALHSRSDLLIFSCSQRVKATSALIGTLGVFMYTVWAYLASDGVLGLTAMQLLETLRYKLDVNAARGDPLFSDARTKRPVLLDDLHVLLIMAFEMYETPDHMVETSFCSACNPVMHWDAAVTDSDGNAEMTDASSVQSPACDKGTLIADRLSFAEISAFGRYFKGGMRFPGEVPGMPMSLWRAMERISRTRRSGVGEPDDPYYRLGRAQIVMLKPNAQRLQAVEQNDGVHISRLYASEQQRRAEEAADDAMQDHNEFAQGGAANFGLRLNARRTNPPGPRLPLHGPSAAARNTRRNRKRANKRRRVRASWR